MAGVLSLPDLVKMVEALMAKVDVLRADHDKLRAEIDARQAANRLGKLEDYVVQNTARIDEMEVRYNGVVDEMNVVADGLQKAVADLAETDEVSGWKKWKEQNRGQAGRTP